MSSKNQPNNAAVVDKCTQRLQALKAHVTAKTEIPIDGVVHKGTDVVAIYQGCLDTRAVLIKKRAEAKVALQDRTNAEEERRAADRGLKAWVQNTFGSASPIAIEFGFPPNRVVTRTVESKMEAIKASRATREARNTMGPKQRKKVKGVVQPPAPPNPAVTPPPQPAPAPADASSSTPSQPPAAPVPSTLNGTASH